MINVNGNCWKPSDGYDYITNGEIYSGRIYLGSNDDISHWRDTNETPADDADALTAEEKLAQIEEVYA